MLRPEQKVAMEHVLSLRTQMRRGILARAASNDGAAEGRPTEPDELFEKLAESDEENPYVEQMPQ